MHWAVFPVERVLHRAFFDSVWDGFLWHGVGDGQDEVPGCIQYVEGI